LSRTVRALACGDYRARAGACGDLPRDMRGMSRCRSWRRAGCWGKDDVRFYIDPEQLRDVFDKLVLPRGWASVGRLAPARSRLG
jgi:hypothetical protein